MSAPDGANRIEVLAGDRSIREVNEEIRAAVAGAGGREVRVRDARSRHNLGVGLSAEARIRFEGSVGYYCGGLNDGARIEIDRNAGWGVGEAMARGRSSSANTRAWRRARRCGAGSFTFEVTRAPAAEWR